MIRILLVLFLLPSLFFVKPSLAEEDLENKIAESADAGTEINVKNADIESLIRIFSKKTKRNYILDERVKGTVSIYLPGKISSEEAIYILDSVLALKGFTAVPIGDNIWKIIPAQEAKQTTVPIVGDGPGRGTPSVVTRFINLKYVSAEDVKQLISSLISPYGLISAYTGTNSLILIDSEDNIKRLMKIIDYLDLPSTDSEMVIIPVEHAVATELAETIKEILSSGDSGDSGSVIPVANVAATRQDRRATRRQPGGTTSNTAQPTSLTVAMRPKEPKIIGDERTNSIIVVADEETTARIQALVEELDSPVDLSGNSYFVYRCQHASAEELAEVLSGLADGGSSSSSSSGNATAREASAERSRERTASQTRTPGQSRTSTSGSGGVSSVSLGENISITADPATNSLIIVANRSDYEKIRKLLKELDVKRRQVLVEALILEVGIDDTISQGFEFNTATGGRDGGVFSANNFGGLASLISNPTQLQDFTLAAASAGSLTLPGGTTIPSHSVLLRASQNNSNVNVLSAPRILATDNEDAEIVVGQNVPFISSTASNQTDLNNVFNQIDRQDVGITLRITPQISSSDFVSLKIFTEVSNVVASTAGSELGPTTTIRTSDTTVIAKDGQMIVTGGLMSDDITESERGIPFLKEVPLLGELFKTTTEVSRRTNLLIFITPRIVKDQFDARDISLEKRDEIQEVIESYDMYPDRQENLYDESLHNVMDGRLDEGTKPGTIRAKKRISKISETIPKITALPEISVAKGTYLIFELTEDLSEGIWPEVFAEVEESLLAVRLPKDVNSSVKNFFQAGRMYHYKFNNSEISLQVVGVFEDLNEAEKYYPALKDKWYTLSSYEILNLGRGPWLQ